jgi:putative hydrolase of the HAD superfamily
VPVGGPRRPPLRVPGDLVYVGRQQPRKLPVVRGDHHRAGRGIKQVQASGVEHHGNTLGERVDRARRGHRAPVLRRDTGAEKPGLHPPPAGNNLGTTLQHQPGHPRRTEVAHHPDSGVQRCLDAQYRCPRELVGTGDDPEHPSRIFVVVLAGNGDRVAGIIGRPCGKCAHLSHDSLDVGRAVPLALNIPGRVVVFDYGEVISLSPNEQDRAVLLATADADPELFWQSYWAHRDDLDHGVLSIRDYWKRIGEDLAQPFSESRIQELWLADFRSWLSVNPEVFDVLAELHAGDTRMALLSNAGFDFASPFRFSPMARFFERVFISAELGMRKPYQEIFDEVAEELGIVPAEMIFIDNKQENVDGAAAFGATSHLFVTVAGLRDFLDALAVPTSGRSARAAFL